MIQIAAQAADINTTIDVQDVKLIEPSLEHEQGGECDGEVSNDDVNIDHQHLQKREAGNQSNLAKPMYGLIHTQQQLLPQKRHSHGDENEHKVDNEDNLVNCDDGNVKNIDNQDDYIGVKVDVDREAIEYGAGSIENAQANCNADVHVGAPDVAADDYASANNETCPTISTAEHDSEHAVNEQTANTHATQEDLMHGHTIATNDVNEIPQARLYHTPSPTHNTNTSMLNIMVKIVTLEIVKTTPSPSVLLTRTT